MMSLYRTKPSQWTMLTSLVVTTLVILGGCITSPYYAQIFDSRSDPIPFQIWTTDKNQDITIECAKASAHGNPYNGEGSYQLVATLTPASEGLLDADGNSIYQASGQAVLPSDCWRNYHYNNGVNWITVVRVLQGTNGDDLIYTFDKAGLKCLGEKNGQHASWFGWLGDGCEKTYINTGEPIRTLFLQAKA